MTSEKGRINCRKRYLVSRLFSNNKKKQHFSSTCTIRERDISRHKSGVFIFAQVMVTGRGMSILDELTLEEAKNLHEQGVRGGDAVALLSSRCGVSEERARRVWQGLAKPVPAVEAGEPVLPSADQPVIETAPSIATEAPEEQPTQGPEQPTSKRASAEVMFEAGKSITAVSAALNTPRGTIGRWRWEWKWNKIGVEMGFPPGNSAAK